MIKNCDFGNDLKLTSKKKRLGNLKAKSGRTEKGLLSPVNAREIAARSSRRWGVALHPTIRAVE
jgi:hypothetical protein